VLLVLTFDLGFFFFFFFGVSGSSQLRPLPTLLLVEPDNRPILHTTILVFFPAKDSPLVKNIHSTSAQLHICTYMYTIRQRPERISTFDGGWGGLLFLFLLFLLSPPLASVFEISCVDCVFLFPSCFCFSAFVVFFFFFSPSFLIVAATVAVAGVEQLHTYRERMGYLPTYIQYILHILTGGCTPPCHSE